MLHHLRSLIVGTLLITVSLLHGQAHTHGNETKTPPPLTECSDGNCSANAGGDLTICVSDVLQLNGVLPAGATDVNWMAAEDNPAVVTISDPSVLDPFIVPINARTLVPGEYTFTIMVTCPDGTISCDDVSVSVGEIGPVSISAPVVNSCESKVIINASPPGPNVTGRWSMDPFNANVTLEEGENGDLIITRNSASNRDCTLDFTYEWSIGRCTESLTTSVSFVQSYSSVIATATILNCRKARVNHTVVGCGGSPVWTLLSGPTSQQDVQFTPFGSNRTDITVTTPGTYTFSFAIDNGKCPSGEATFVLTFPKECDPGCPDLIDELTVSLLTCTPFEDINNFTLMVPARGGVSYQWTTSNNPASSGITIDILSPNSPATQVSIQTSPDGYRWSNIIFTLRATSIKQPTCFERKHS